MPPRRSHRKSRHGCLLCKQRRVKCDEAGPPCGNCRARGTECQYAQSDSSSHSSPMSSDSLLAHQEGKSNDGYLVFPANRQVLELQLMHRWSTVTFYSISSGIAKDHEMWQKTVPNLALRYDYLLNGLFSIAAFEIAAAYGSTRMQYVNAALEYQAIAIRGFQTQLTNITQESHDASLYFSIVLMAMSLASAQFTTSEGGLDRMIENTVIHFQLVRGAGAIMMECKDSISKHSLFRNMKPITSLQRSPLDPMLEIFISKLNRLNDERDHSSSPLTHPSQMRSLIHAASCKKALFWLHECFETCVEVGYRDYCLGWPSLAGDEYITAIRDKDRIALLILMYWGILVERLSSDYWWARGFGRSLIVEITNNMPDHPDEVTREVIDWAREQVGMDIHDNVV